MRSHHYGVTDRDEVLRLARDARRRSTHRVPDWAKTFVGMEADAAASIMIKNSVGE